MSRGASVKERLAGITARRWLLVGIGNNMRGDDAFGPLLARRLKGKGLPALDVGTAPENFTGVILEAMPEEVILADAAELQERVGTLRLLEPGEISGGGPSTHDPGLALLLKYLAGRRNMSLRILAVQPGTVGLGEAMSAEVSEALEGLVDLFRSSAC